MRKLLLCLLPALFMFTAAPVRAAVVLTVEAPQGRIDLFDEIGPCVADARQAMFTDRASGNQVLGCWVTIDELVQIAFLDADIARVPQKEFKKPSAS